MVTKKLKVTNSQGFHMRPATVFVNEMAKFKSNVTIVFNGTDVNGKSLMNLIAACTYETVVSKHKAIFLCGIRQCDRGCARYCSGHIANAVVDDAVKFEDWVVVRSYFCRFAASALVNCNIDDYAARLHVLP